ncbi:MAG TPA: TonB-dependent receptor [Pseudolabrys sp.]|jgi:vitamin B12 transporter
MGTEIRLAGAALALGLYTQAAQAQDVPLTLPPIVVSATTVPTLASELGSSVSVITAADIAREQLRTVPDALKTVPGVEVVQTGGPGGQTSVFMRGSNANHVKVLIDGIDVSNPSITNGAFDFGHLLTGDIATIEVLRGPQSGLYGSDAIGGVIAITTKKGEGPPKATASLEAGSFGTFNQTMGVSGSQANFNYAFNVVHFRSTSIPVTPLDLLKPGQTRNNDSYDNWTYSTKLNLGLADNLAVNLIGRYTDAKLGFTGEDFSTFPLDYPEALQSTQRNHNLYSRGEVVWSPVDRFTSTVGVNYTNQWDFTVNPNGDFAANSGFASPTVGPPVTNLGERTKVDWRGEIKVAPGQTVVVGLERERQSLRTDSTGTVDGGFNYTQTTTTANTGNKAAYAELQSEFGKRVFLAANVRGDDNDSFGPHTTWRLAPAVIVPVTETKLKGSYGTGFKAPSLTQLYVNNPSFNSVANPNLRPETSKGYDFGFEQPLLNGRVNFGVTYFHNSVRDLINNEFDPVSFKFSYDNIGQATMYGTESFASVAFNDQWRVRGDYTTLTTRDEATGLALRNRPRHKESLTVVWTPTPKFTLSTTLLYVGSAEEFNRDGTVSRVDSDAYALVNVAAEYRLDERVTVFGRINNLLDRHYESPVGFDQPGFGVYAGIRVTSR